MTYGRQNLKYQIWIKLTQPFRCLRDTFTHPYIQMVIPKQFLSFGGLTCKSVKLSSPTCVNAKKKWGGGDGKQEDYRCQDFSLNKSASLHLYQFVLILMINMLYVFNYNYLVPSQHLGTGKQSWSNVKWISTSLWASTGCELWEPLTRSHSPGLPPSWEGLAAGIWCLSDSFPGALTKGTVSVPSTAILHWRNKCCQHCTAPKHSTKSQQKFSWMKIVILSVNPEVCNTNICYIKYNKK